MSNEKSQNIKRVLIIEDNEEMHRALRDAFDEFNENRLRLPAGIVRPKSIFFETHWCQHPDLISTYLKGTPIWDVFVIDRMFGQEKLAVHLLRSLKELQAPGLRIIWTAYAVVENLIDCMRLGAWDYLNKNDPRFGDTFMDVVVSAIEGIREMEMQLQKAEIDQNGNKFVVDNYHQIYGMHKGNFVAFAKDDQGNWKIEPVAKDPSLAGLYLKLEDAGKDHTKVHITLIHE